MDISKVNIITVAKPVVSKFEGASGIMQSWKLFVGAQDLITSLIYLRVNQFSCRTLHVTMAFWSESTTFPMGKQKENIRFNNVLKINQKFNKHE